MKSGAINEVFFSVFNSSICSCLTEMFDGVKSERDAGVVAVAAVTKYTNLYFEESILLANTLLPELADTLSMQRGKFYGFGTQPEFSVLEQAVHFDKGIAQNFRWNENAMTMTTD